MSAERDKIIVPSNFELQLEAKPNIQKCIICQNINDKKGINT